MFDFKKILDKRNAMLDGIFYDVESLTTAERNRLTMEKNPEGGVIIIFPAASKKDYIAYETAQAFMASEHKSVTRYVIAGVGSSDLGGAALARNVADHYQEPVAAIVAGYGVRDLMQEALGGWFSLGGANRDASEVEKAREEAGKNGSSLGDDGVEFVVGNPDSNTMLAILLNKAIKVDLILGHSKGCLSLSNALYGLLDFGQEAVINKRIEEVRVVTTGAVIELPDAFTHIYQFLGSIDWFGGMNSRIGMDFKPVFVAWHHTNTNIPFNMSIGKLLGKLNEKNEVTT